MSTAKIYWHLPGAEQVKYWDEFGHFATALYSITQIPDVNQYIGIIECQGRVTRYLVTKGAGSLEVIPMEDEKKGWTEKKKMVSEIVNFVMGNHELPLLPVEEDEHNDEV